MRRHAAVRVWRAGTASRRLRAILAGGLVLGLGAAVTLAAWNDAEYATADFGAGVFGIQGSTNGTAFADHPVGSPATLTFSVAVTAMAPGSVSYSLFSVRTIMNSVAGTVQITADPLNAATGTLGQYLRYEVRTISDTTCTGATFPGGTSLTPALSTLATNPTGPQTVLANSATPVNYCFRFDLPSTTANAAQGTTLTAKWTFSGANS